MKVQSKNVWTSFDMEAKRNVEGDINHAASAESNFREARTEAVLAVSLGATGIAATIELFNGLEKGELRDYIELMSTVGKLGVYALKDTLDAVAHGVMGGVQSLTNKN